MRDKDKLVTGMEQIDNHYSPQKKLPCDIDELVFPQVTNSFEQTK